MNLSKMSKLESNITQNDEEEGGDLLQLAEKYLTSNKIQQQAQFAYEQKLI